MFERKIFKSFCCDFIIVSILLVIIVLDLLCVTNTKLLRPIFEYCQKPGLKVFRWHSDRFSNGGIQKVRKQFLKSDFRSLLYLKWHPEYLN